MVALLTAVPSSFEPTSDHTSRAAFRAAARSAGATNRQADALRRILLDAWEVGAGTSELSEQLSAAGPAERLTVWFSFAGPGGTQDLTSSDPVFDSVEPELCGQILTALSPTSS